MAARKSGYPRGSGYELTGTSLPTSRQARRHAGEVRAGTHGVPVARRILRVGRAEPVVDRDSGATARGGWGSGIPMIFTYVPEPRLVFNQPSAESCSYAFSTTPRATFICADSARLLGNRSPASSCPAWMAPRMRSASCTGRVRAVPRSNETVTDDGSIATPMREKIGLALRVLIGS